jgi:hypothetical protein
MYCKEMNVLQRGECTAKEECSAERSMCCNEMDVLRVVIMDAAISNDLIMGHRGFGNPGVRRELAKLFKKCYPTNEE